MDDYCICNEDGDIVEVRSGAGSDGCRYFVTDGCAERRADDGEVLGQFDIHKDRATIEALIADLPGPAPKP